MPAAPKSHAIELAQSAETAGDHLQQVNERAAGTGGCRLLVVFQLTLLPPILMTPGVTAD